MPVAYWSQGPHDGWGGGFGLGARKRRSPTPDELRAQAMHALSTRITSLYWFNLSAKSLVKFPDTWEPIMRIGREIQMLSPIYLAGDAYQFERTRNSQGKLDWDCASIVSEECALLFALDLAYEPNAEDSTFQFGEPRDFSYHYKLPYWLSVSRRMSFESTPMDFMRCNGVLKVMAYGLNINSVVTQFLLRRNPLHCVRRSSRDAKPPSISKTDTTTQRT